MSARQKPLHQEVAKFVIFHLGKGCFVPFTGTDWPAWRAFVYLVQCYSHGGSENAIAAMRATVRCAQPSADILRCFVQAIPAVMDWGDVARLWPRISEDIRLHTYDRGDDVRQIAAYERAMGRDEKPTDNVRLHGWSSP